MPSKMLLEVDRKLSHVIPLSDEEAIWLRKRLDKLYEQMAGVQPGEIVSITPILDSENDDWVLTRYLPPKEESKEDAKK